MFQQTDQSIRLASDASTRPKPAGQRSTRRYRALPFLLAVFILGLWYLLTRSDGDTAFILAPPQAVALKFVELVGNGTLLRHVGTTLLEIGIGFALGVGCAFLIGYGIARNWLLDQVFSPYVVGFQAVPIVAIAPVLIRFFGPGILSNGIICALIVFFPMLVSTIVGIRGVDPTLHDLMRSLTATRWQMFTRLEVPAALPVLFGGLKISTTLAVAAGVVGEAISANAGLGFLIYSSRYVYDTSSVLVGVFTLTALALALYALVGRVEGRLLRWQRRGR